MREAHGVQGFEGRPQIGAVCEGAAAAVHDEIRRFGNGARPFLQISQALRCGSRSVERRSGNVPTLVEKTRGNANYRWLAVTGEFLGERSGIDRLGSCPGFWFWGSSRLRKKSRRRHRMARRRVRATDEVK